VKAVVGGLDYRKSQYNRATQARRQPGSLFKLFVYLAGLENGFTPQSQFEDRPVRIGKWAPGNYSGRYEGWMNLRYAFAQSVNTVAVQLAQQVGVPNVAEMARRLGINSKLTRDASLSLGTSEVTLMEITGAFAHLPSQGRLVVPYAIERITTRNGRILYQRSAPSSPVVLSNDTVQMANNLARETVRSGTGRGAVLAWPVAGKTGTSQDFRDAWFIGYTGQLVTGVWVGNDNNQRMKKVTGGSLPVKIWKSYMVQAMQGQPVLALPESTGGWQGFGLFREDGDPSSSGPHTVGQPVPGSRQVPAQPARPQQGRDVELQPSFWQKLFGDEVKVEGRYPEERR
jgi:penicillin-binding protein 1A